MSDVSDNIPADMSAEAEAAMLEAQARLLGVPAETVVTNHAMGLYELAAIHLRSDEPELDQARLAIDALAALVEGLGDRLGEHSTTMAEALANIRFAYVSVQKRLQDNAN